MALRRRGHEIASTMVVESAIDMRRCLPDHRDAMGNLVSGVNETIVLSSRSDDHAGNLASPTSAEWDAMRRTTDELARASNTVADQSIALLAYLNDFWRWTKKRTENKPDLSFSTSNLGVFDEGVSDPSEQSTWSVKDVMFSQSADATGSPFNLNVACTKGGQLALNISWWPGMLGVDDEDVFVEEILDYVEKMMLAT